MEERAVVYSVCHFSVYETLVCATSAHSPVQTLEGWDAVPIAAPLTASVEATSITRAWSPIRVPGHWQLEDAFVAYEGSHRSINGVEEVGLEP